MHYDPEAMTLSMDQIEALKRSSLNSGREVIDKMIKHIPVFDKKTTFSQEKYVKRKEQKFCAGSNLMHLDLPKFWNCILKRGSK